MYLDICKLNVVSSVCDIGEGTLLSTWEVTGSAKSVEGLQSTPLSTR